MRSSSGGAICEREGTLQMLIRDQGELMLSQDKTVSWTSCEAISWSLWQLLRDYKNIV